MLNVRNRKRSRRHQSNEASKKTSEFQSQSQSVRDQSKSVWENFKSRFAGRLEKKSTNAPETTTDASSAAVHGGDSVRRGAYLEDTPRRLLDVCFLAPVEEDLRVVDRLVKIGTLGLVDNTRKPEERSAPCVCGRSV